MLDHALRVEYFARAIAVCPGPLSCRQELQQQVLDPLQKLRQLCERTLSLGLPGPPEGAPFRSGIQDVHDWQEWEWERGRAVKDLPAVCQQMVEQIIAIAPPFPEDPGDEEQRREFAQGQQRAIETFQQGMKRLQDARDRLWRFQQDMDSFPAPGLATAGQAISTPAGVSDPTARRKTGRPKKEEKDSATKVVAALSAHHGYGEGMSVTNREPATNRGLRQYGVSGNALSRFLNAKLGEGGHRKYKAACRTGRIGVLLSVWRGETPSRLLDLQPHESGREDDQGD
jgi:hypothetical protein